MIDKRKLQIRRNNKKPLIERVACIKCGSKRLIKKGVRKTETKGIVQRWQCKRCHATVSSSGAYMHKNRTPKEILILILASHINKMTARKIKKECWKRYHYYISHTSIVRYLNYVKGGKHAKTSHKAG